jgi:hypothetical protein
VITDREPPEPVTVESPRAETLQRLHAGKLYLLAVRNAEAAVAETVAFRFPAKSRYAAVKVLFEGRAIRPKTAGFEDRPPAAGFEDRFAAPRAVHVYELTP